MVSLIHWILNQFLGLSEDGLVSKDIVVPSVFEWKTKDRSEHLYVGGARLGSVYYSGVIPKGDPNVWGASCDLPGIRNNLERFEHKDDARKAVEALAAQWLEKLPLIELVEQIENHPVRLHHDDSVRFYHFTSYLIGTRTDLDDAFVAAQTHEEFNEILDNDMATRNAMPLSMLP